jgi:hypothetical protein
MPSVYPTHSSVGLAWTGYELTSTNIINFDLSIYETTSTTLMVKVEAFDDLEIRKLGLYVVLVNPVSDWVWLFTQSSYLLIKISP